MGIPLSVPWSLPAFSWLTSLPVEEFGFTFSLHKRASQDALALRYNWQPLKVVPIYTLVWSKFHNRSLDPYPARMF